MLRLARGDVRPGPQLDDERRPGQRQVALGSQSAPRGASGPASPSIAPAAGAEAAQRAGAGDAPGGLAQPRLVELARRDGVDERLLHRRDRRPRRGRGRSAARRRRRRAPAPRSRSTPTVSLTAFISSASAITSPS